MSSESTPILSRAIIHFEMFMTGLEELGKHHKILKPWTQIGLRWATKYYIRMDDTDVYVITMCTFIDCYILLLGRQPILIVLNPAIHLSWIEDQWDDQYIENSKGMILSLVSTIYHYIPPFHPSLAQMRQYRAKRSSTPATVVSDCPVQPTPPARGKPLPTRFKIDRSIYQKKAVPQEFTVDAEYRKYALGEISSEETDILRFWEVRSLFTINLNQLTP